MKEVIAIIGGSGIEQFKGWYSVGTQCRSTDYGQPSSAIETYACADAQLYFLPRHGRPHHLAPHCINYRANLRALHDLGVTCIVALNTVGGITSPAGALVIPDQIVDYTYGRQHTFYDDAQTSVRHIDFSEPYSNSVRRQLLEAARQVGIAVVDGGVYAATQGPRLESAAEIRRLERDGCDIVGMTGMPEAALARELNIEYASLCVVVNAAAGKTEQPLTVAAMASAMSAATSAIEKILTQFVGDSFRADNVDATSI